MVVSSTAMAMAQSEEKLSEDNTIYINNSGDNVKMSEDGGLTLVLNGMRIKLGNSKVDNENSGYSVRFSDGTTIALTKKQIESLPAETLAKLTAQDEPKKRSKFEERVGFGFCGLDSPSYNHFAAIEVGTNIFTLSDYSAYSPEEAQQLSFTRSKSRYMAVNLVTMNVLLNRRKTLVASMAFGFTTEYYRFSGDYTMEFRDGMVHAVALDSSVKRSEMQHTMIHLPITLDWNIKRGWFLSVGANIDVSMGTSLFYKKPRTTVTGVVKTNPVQIGLTARVGWRRLYGFVNYSPMELFKHGTGPKIYRMSAGMGFWF